MMVYGAFISFMELPKIVGKNILKHTNNKKHMLLGILLSVIKSTNWVPLVIVFGSSFLYLTYFKFSIPYQAYLLALTALFAYQLAIIGGEFGLAPVGRFATFVMVPAMFIFGINSVKMSLIVSGFR